MPNIEVYGFTKKAVFDKIVNIVKENFPDEVDDTVITFIDSKVFDLAGESRPYIRMIHTSNKKAEEMGMVFSRYFEVEVLALGNYFEIEEIAF
ncbi:MAG: hypothetical protein PHW52_05060 [Candidatus Pacebacteria bacterium]|nr:hypothetical protein [Candidatus Paceibacterota bacterium]